MAASLGCSHVTILGQRRPGKNDEDAWSSAASHSSQAVENNLKGFEPMHRIFVAVAMTAFLSACADDMTIKHHNPPQDPPDYHGVPTDTRPPTMIDNPPPAQ
jgi:hypothetical protein